MLLGKKHPPWKRKTKKANLTGPLILQSFKLCKQLTVPLGCLIIIRFQITTISSYKYVDLILKLYCLLPKTEHFSIRIDPHLKSYTKSISVRLTILLWSQGMEHLKGDIQKYLHELGKRQVLPSQPGPLCAFPLPLSLADWTSEEESSAGEKETNRPRLVQKPLRTAGNKNSLQSDRAFK